MAQSARLALSARRFELRTFTIVVRGLDLTDVDFGMQVRLYPDTAGTPLLKLDKVATAAAEGLKLERVDTLAGLPVSTIVGRINKSSMSEPDGLGRVGEPGVALEYAYALRIGDTTRLHGPFWTLPGVVDADGAVATGEFSGGTSRTIEPSDNVHLNVVGSDIIQVAIDGADIVAGYAEIAKQAVDLVAETQSIVPADDDELFLWVDADGKVIAKLTAEGKFLSIAQPDANERRFRFYSFDGSVVGQETLNAYEGLDGLNFPNELPVGVSGLPQGVSVRDPSVERDPETGIYWMVFSAWSFATGPAAASFGVARSDNGMAFDFVGLVSLLDVPTPEDGTEPADRAWAPEWVRGPGFLGVWVSTNFGTTDPANSNDRMVPLLFKVTSPDRKQMRFLGHITGSEIPFNCIDGTAIFTNGVWLACVKDEAATTLHIVWSEDVRTGYDSEGSTGTASWGGSIEGPSLVPIGSGIIRCYYDRYNGSGMFARDSHDGGATFGAEQAVAAGANNAATERHGSVIIIEGDR